jgi:Protein of unknown function (DUF402)
LHHRASVRLRGIYTTALTALLLEQGYTIVDASPAIQERFGIPHRGAPEEVNIFDRRNRQGVVVEGEHSSVRAVVRSLQKALPQALFSPASREAWGTGEGEDSHADLPRALPVRRLAEFPATVKAQLDRRRSPWVPTIPGHHALKTIDPAAVDEAEAELMQDPRQGEILARKLRQDLVYRHFQSGAEILVRHIKARQSPIVLRGHIKSCQSGLLVLVRHFQGGGVYDGLGLPIETGDWGTIILREGEWVTVRQYFRRQGTLVGELYNIGTPVEFYPDHLRYVDLELDVVRLPDGTSRLEDVGVLVDKLARGLLPPALGEEAIHVAVRLLQSPSAASHGMQGLSP